MNPHDHVNLGPIQMNPQLLAPVSVRQYRFVTDQQSALLHRSETQRISMQKTAPDY